MGIETDLNVSPYYDDANNAINDNYHRILFRPAVPVQARELTQLQDILQNQIERFGDNIFTAGTIIKGCSFSYDPNYNYVKLLDLRPIDTQPVQPSSYPGMIGYEATSNLYAVCVNYQDGYESQNPDLKTLYFKYINAGTSGQSAFSPGSQITFYQTTDINTARANNGINSYQFANADVTIASVTNAVGRGYAMSVSSGVIFQKGHFIQVPSTETAVISKYSQYPSNVVAGFVVSENIVTEYQDTTLLDNATGYTNLNAPGAHRLQLYPTLTAYASNAVPSNNFFSLVEWQNGNITRSFQETQYSVLGNEMARREYETNGNFVVKPFGVTMQDGNTTHNYAVVSSGLAYVDGHRVETFNNINIPVRKGTDTTISTGQTLKTQYNNSILVGEYVGVIPTHVGPTISLRSAAGAKVSNNQFANGTPAGTEIGTAKALALQYETGTVGTPNSLWRLYLTDIRMNLGKNFRDIRGVHYSGGSGNAFADVARSLDSSSNSYVAMIQNPSNSSLVFPTSKKGVQNFTQSSNLPKYIYRTISNTTLLASSGQSSIIALGNTTVFPYGSNVTLTSAQEESIHIIPYAIDGGATYANVTLTKSGNLVITNGSANVIANASTTTSFSTDYQIGDFVAAGGVINQITNISNSTFMTMQRPYASTNASATHAKCYPINHPINVAQRNSKIDITDANAQNMKITLLAANGAAETLSANISIAVTHNAKQPAATDRNLQANNDIVVKINTSNNTNGVAGPWFLGIPYVHRLKNVYKSSNTGTIVGNTTSGCTYITTATSGFSNGVVVNGPGIPAGATANVLNATTLVLSATATATATYQTIKYAYYSTSANDDVTGSFTLRKGMKDAFYDHSYIQLNTGGVPCPVANGDLLTVVFDALKPGSSGSGYITADSYKTLVDNGVIAWEDVHSHPHPTGKELLLRDSVDFRTFAVNTAVYTNSTTAATINPPYSTTFGDVSNNTPTANTELYLAAVDQLFEHDIYHYVGRVDKLIMNSYGKFQIVEGKPGNNPVPPADIKGTMTIATISIPPYPSYAKTLKTTNVATSYVSATTTQQNRVYTMKDIAKLDKRVDNLEYYTSLNMLEQKTRSLTVVSDITGANRFKNGIFVDNFETLDMLDISNPEFKIGFSTSEGALVPKYTMDTVTLRYANGNGTSANGGVIRVRSNPTDTEVSIIHQDLSTETVRCADAQYTYTGVVSCKPPFHPIPDPKPVICVPPKPVKAPDPAPNIATYVSNIGNKTAKAGDTVLWSIGAGGYASMTVSIVGPGSYSYSKSLTTTDATLGKFGAAASINNVLPGTYTMTVTRSVLGGYTESGVNEVYNNQLTVYPVTPAVTPDTGKGVGQSTGGLTTIIVANTDTIIKPVVTANTANVNATYGITIRDPGEKALFGGRDRDVGIVGPFNTHLVTKATGTPNTSTSTSSSANTVAAANVFPGIAGGGREFGGTGRVNNV
jgi:hypothetical protein